MILQEKNKNNLKVAIQMDSLDKINKKTDSTLALIQEAFKRNYTIFIYTVDSLSLIDNKPKAFAQKVLKINMKNEKFLSLANNYFNLYHSLMR